MNCMSRVIVWTYNTSGSRKNNNTLGPDPGRGPGPARPGSGLGFRPVRFSTGPNPEPATGPASGAGMARAPAGPGPGQEHLCHVYLDSTVALLKSAFAPASAEPQATSPGSQVYAVPRVTQRRGAHAWRSQSVCHGHIHFVASLSTPPAMLFSFLFPLYRTTHARVQ